MKLVHPDYERQIEFKENQVIVWVIESPIHFQKIVQELLWQCNGEEGNFVLSDGDKLLRIDKTVELIINPYAITVNQRKILNKIYSDIAEVASQSEYYMKTQACFSVLEQYLSEIEQEMTYDFIWNSDQNINQLLKAFDVRLDEMEGNMLERVIQYISVLANVLNVSVIVLVNIKSYLDETEILELYKSVKYMKVYLILLENKEMQPVSGELKMILDKDGCEI